MSMTETLDTRTRNRARTALPNGSRVRRLALVRKTIFVGFPTPSPVTCPAPFHASGNSAATTVMDATATIVTPEGDLTGDLLNPPDAPFTWTYEFADELPSGVPLAL